MPQGIIPSKLAEIVDLSRQNLNRYLRKLEKKGYVRKAKLGILTYYFTINDSAAVQVAKTVYPIPQKKQRPHAIQVAAKLYRTSQGRAKETLEAMWMPYKPTLRGNISLFQWKGHELRLSSSGKLIAHPKLPEMPLAIPLDKVQEGARREAGRILEDFLSGTGLRAMRSQTGELALEVTYWENGFPQNEIAEETLKDKARIVYAYDRVTGADRIWGDSSPNPFKELETNSAIAEPEIKLMMQAIEDREIRPYADEMRTRQQIDALSVHQGQMAENIASIAHNLRTHVPFMKYTMRGGGRHKPKVQPEGQRYL